jgi:ribosome-binding protein aMBF1 (putative translation factor)
MKSHDELIAELLSDPVVKAEADRLNNSEEFILLDIVLAARQASGLTQAEVAARMGTQAPAVARLESAMTTGKHSPTLATLRKYVEACGKHLVVSVK